MSLIEITEPTPSIPAGTYPLTLTKVEATTIVPKTGPDAGVTLEKYRWHFALTMPGDPLDGEQIDALTGRDFTPRANFTKFLIALFGGRPPAIGTKLEAKDLEGRMALGTIVINDAGWPKIDALSAMPAYMLSGQVAQATGAPLAVAPQVAEQPEFVAPPGGFAAQPQPFPGSPAPVAEAPTSDLPF